LGFCKKNWEFFGAETRNILEYNFGVIGVRFWSLQEKLEVSLLG
jgi:hypothetical protein